MPYSVEVTLSNGSRFMAKKVECYDNNIYPENSRVCITVDAADYPYSTILSTIGNGNIDSVTVTEYRSFKKRGEIVVTTDIVDTKTYTDYGVNLAINYHKDTDEYTIDLYKIDEVTMEGLKQEVRIVDIAMGILDTYEIVKGGIE